MDSQCKCPSCLDAEQIPSEVAIPYRYVPGRGQALFALALHGSLPLLSIVLIGWSWWALAPVAGFLAAYLVNSLLLCPACAYHHAEVRLCGCYPKSLVPYRRYRGSRWGYRENIVGRGAVVLLTVGPPGAVLAARGEHLSAIVLVFAAVTVVFLTSIFSCPVCRQRSVCYLGKLSMAAISRDEGRERRTAGRRRGEGSSVRGRP
jgi:hypothetical protein